MLQFGNLGQWKDGPPDIWAVLLLAAQVLNLAKVGDKTVKLAKLREGFLETKRKRVVSSRISCHCTQRKSKPYRLLILGIGCKK